MKHKRKDVQLGIQLLRRFAVVITNMRRPCEGGPVQPDPKMFCINLPLKQNFKRIIFILLSNLIEISFKNIELCLKF